MQHLWSLEGVQLQRAWLSIGSFDGVHLGHQAIVRRLVESAHRAEAPAVVITFFPHPAVVLGKRKDPIYLTTPEERAGLLGELGVDIVITHPFNRQVAAMSAREFVERLHEHLGMEHLLVGYNFALGRGREGDVPALERFGQEYGFEVEVMPALTNSGELISSSHIRQKLAEGSVEDAARLLGRPYRVAGRVVHGDDRGRALGIPTANLDVWAERALPGKGVYACRALAEGEWWKAVANIGVRPTFENALPAVRVEAHLLDFEGNLYGEEIQLDFIARLRDEQKFPGVEALVAQIHTDIERARRILS